MQSIVSRSLGPKQFGDFSFLTNFITQLILIFDLGNSSGFFVKLSQRQKELPIISFYIYFTTAGFLLIGLILLIVFNYPNIYNLIFPDQLMIFVSMAIIWGILSRYLQILNNISDAFGYTVSSEKALILQKIIGLVLIGMSFYLNKLQLTNYFYIQFAILSILIVFFLLIIKGSGIFTKQYWILSYEEIISYTKEFAAYSMPLFLGFVIGVLGVMTDRWLLQYFAGSIEQGFYGLSFQLASLSTVFAGAMTMLIMREFSIAFGKKDLTQMTYIFRRFIPLLYSLTAFISCFVVIQADKVIFLVGGDQYNSALIPVAIMCFYPIHQTYGQLSGSVLLASGQTKLYARLTILSTLVGLPFLYLLLSPNIFKLGAVGLGLKMVVIQVIFVNIQLYYNSRFLQINFKRYLLHQLLVVVVLVCISTASYYIVDHIILRNAGLILRFITTGMLYCLLTLGVVLINPLIFGIHPIDALRVRQILKNYQIKA